MFEKLAEDIDSSVCRIIDSAHEIAKNHLRNNKEGIEKLVQVLLEKLVLHRNYKHILINKSPLDFKDFNQRKI